MANTLSLMTNSLRNVVSRQRIRYKQNGFDLDLAYICNNIIAMGYPAENIESIFRNNSDHVYQFFEEKHKDHYKIYNLCSERNYDGKKFHGRVAVYPFDDHNPPPIKLIKDFCDDVDDWLNADKHNVAAVHCKAGKGRTGTMICCYLLHSKLKTTAEDALAFYDEKRTKNKKGVTIPSQRRYVEYYAKLVNSAQPYEERTVQICEIKCSSQLSNQDNVYCSICNNPRSDGDPESNNITLNFRKTQTIEINDRCIPLTGDVKIEIYRKVMKKKEKYFHFWFNTYFLCDTAAYVHGDDSEPKFIYELSKCELDDAHKDTVHKTVPEDFKVQLVFKLVPRHQVASNENSHNNHHVIQGQLQNYQNHNNQLPTNLHHNSINSHTANIGPTTRVPSSIRRPLLSPATGLNHQNQIQPQAQHHNQKHQQNDSNATKRKHYQNNQNHHSNDFETLGNVVLRQSDEEIPVKQQPVIVGSNDVAAAAAAAIHTPSVSSDVSRTNSSSRSSSINSEVSSNAGEEDWESGEFIIPKHKDDAMLMAMVMMDADYNVKQSFSSSSHPNINLSSSIGNCNSLPLSLKNELRHNNHNLNNNNRKSSIDIEENMNYASNNSGSSTSSKLISIAATTAGSKSAKSKSFNKSLGLHNTINNNNINKKTLQKRRWLSNMKSDPDLCETLVKSVNFRNAQSSSSGGMTILGARGDTGGGHQNRTRYNSTTDHDDYYSSLCDKQLSFGGVSPVKSPRSVNIIKSEQTDQKKSEIDNVTLTGNNLVIAKPIESHSIGFRIDDNNTKDSDNNDDETTAINNCQKISSQNQIITISEESSCSLNSNSVSVSALKMCDSEKALLTMISSSPPICKVNRCVSFSFRAMRQELQSVIKNKGKCNRKNSNKLVDRMLEENVGTYITKQEENIKIPSTSSGILSVLPSVSFIGSSASNGDRGGNDGSADIDTDIGENKKANRIRESK